MLVFALSCIAGRKQLISVLVAVGGYFSFFISGDPVHTPPNSDLGHCFDVQQTGHMAKFNMSCTFSCVKSTSCDPKS